MVFGCGNSANVSIEGNTIYYNGVSGPYPQAAGVHLWSNDLTGFSITGNAFAGNYNGIYNEDANTVDATGNWWNAASGPYEDSGVPDACGLTLQNASGSGDPVSECVLYSPWLTADPFGTPSSSERERTPYVPPSSATGGLIPVTGGTTTTAVVTDADLEQFASGQFPLTADENGAYQFACVLESVTTLDEAGYITVGDKVITSVGQCSYLVNGVKQTVTVALSFLGGEASFVPGAVLTIGLNSEDAGQMSFAVSGDPLDVNNFLVPASIEETGNITE